jgi:hypothetical protein
MNSPSCKELDKQRKYYKFDPTCSETLLIKLFGIVK